MKLTHETTAVAVHKASMVSVRPIPRDDREVKETLNVLGKCVTAALIPLLTVLLVAGPC